MGSFGFPPGRSVGGFYIFNISDNLTITLQMITNALNQRKDRTIKRIPLYYSLLAIHAKAGSKLLLTPRYERESECTYRVKFKTANR
jgi:hypothetical protein